MKNPFEIDLPATSAKASVAWFLALAGLTGVLWPLSVVAYVLALQEAERVGEDRVVELTRRLSLVGMGLGLLLCAVVLALLVAAV